MSKPGSDRYEDIPLEIVGSTKFGRYPKISSEQTYNMIISDDGLVPFAGYQAVSIVNPNGEGRGILSSVNLNKIFSVIDNNLWIFDSQIYRTLGGKLASFMGSVFMAENNAGQVAISDLQNIYIYDSTTNITTTLTPTILGFTPGFITFQDGRFISPDINTNLWRLSAENNGLSWPTGAQFEGSLQTKPDKAVATLRFPGRGNLLLVFGKTVTELWYDVGAQLFPYQRSQSSNIDYGCINSATIAANETTACWVATNEQSGAAIMYTDGGEIKRISNDGIDFKLATLKNPSDCFGFIFRQDGHLIYVVSWKTDNLSYAFDFNTQRFFTLCDENMNFFVARSGALFNNKYYFVSINDGNLYQLSSAIYSYSYGNESIFEIPRIRITKNIRKSDQSRFVIGYAGFTIEQGQFDVVNTDTDNLPRIDMSLSKDGSVNFGNIYSKKMRPQGLRQNKLWWRNLGSANDLSIQYRFWGFQRFVAIDGVVGVYQ